MPLVTIGQIERWYIALFFCTSLVGSEQIGGELLREPLISIQIDILHTQGADSSHFLGDGFSRLGPPGRCFWSSSSFSCTPPFP
jgi:hypothetical protein